MKPRTEAQVVRATCVRPKIGEPTAAASNGLSEVQAFVRLPSRVSEDVIPRVDGSVSRLSREFEDIDLRDRSAANAMMAGDFMRAGARHPGCGLELTTTHAGTGSTRAERMRARAGRMLSRTRSFAPARHSRSGVIDESAVPDPDVVLFADAILAQRDSPHKMSRLPASTEALDDRPDAHPVTSFMRLSKAQGPATSVTRERPREHETYGFSGPPKACGFEEMSEASAAGRTLGDSRIPATLATESGSGGCAFRAPATHMTNGAHAAGSTAAGTGTAGGRVASTGMPMSEADDGLLEASMGSMRRQIEKLTAQLAASEAALSSAQEQSHEWRRCVQEVFNGLLLNPRMNLKYELKVARLLEKAVGRLDRIETVRYVKCSFPSVPTDAPQLQLRRWGSLDESEWEVTFSPRWKMEMCLEGHTAFLPFKLLVRVGGIRLHGEMRVSFPPDMAYTLISFMSACHAALSSAFRARAALIGPAGLLVRPHLSDM